MSSQVTVVDHPLVQHKLTILRKKETKTGEFRRLLKEISIFLGIEALKDLPLEDYTIDTPVSPMIGKRIKGKKPCLVPILRAGDGFLSGFTDLIPNARIGHIGMARNEETLIPETYLFKMPGDLDKRAIIVIDPMLATGGSCISAIDQLKKAGAKNIRFVCLVASPEGVEALTKAHPDVAITVAAVDEKLNEVGYIIPGLGDAGDRLFGTL